MIFFKLNIKSLLFLTYLNQRDFCFTTEDACQTSILPLSYIYSGPKNNLDRSYSQFSEVKSGLRKLMLAQAHRRLCVGSSYHAFIHINLPSRLGAVFSSLQKEPSKGSMRLAYMERVQQELRTSELCIVLAASGDHVPGRHLPNIHLGGKL